MRGEPSRVTPTLKLRKAQNARYFYFFINRPHSKTNYLYGIMYRPNEDNMKTLQNKTTPKSDASLILPFPSGSRSE